ncbi:MAG: glutamate 5-kinase [Saprospiraceae bacterium]|nr:glutamate 5-kinase [Saprospiraceae bacterium]
MKTRIVVKIGTNVLQNEDGLDDGTIREICRQLAILVSQGYQVILVSSGAVGAGKLKASSIKVKSPVVQQQIFAAVGQLEMMRRYEKLLSAHSITIAQVLATKEDFRDRRHYINMRNCMEGLLHENILPIVNENDVVSLRELMFTDNDELAGLIAAMVGAEKLILLTSVSGIMSHPPHHPEAKLIREVKEASQLDAFSIGAKSSMGRGGMAAKISTIKKTIMQGIGCHIVDGKVPNILIKLMIDKEACGTYVPAQADMSTVKKWLATLPAEHTMAAVTVNKGAQEALQSPLLPTSLLPIGVAHWQGNFDKGDVISILSTTGELIGLGMAAYDADQLKAYLGKKNKKAIIHYDYLYLL